LIIIRRDDCIDLLFKLLSKEIFLFIYTTKNLFVIEAPKQHSEELLVHVLMALNNLSYYDDPQSYIIRNADTLAQCKIKIREKIFVKIFCCILVLVKYIRNEEKMDCVVEAFRVLGNLSRAKRIRDISMKCKSKKNKFFFD
jgi:hypothetical protein